MSAYLQENMEKDSTFFKRWDTLEQVLYLRTYPTSYSASYKGGLWYGQVTLPEDIFSNQDQKEYENRQEQLAIDREEASAKQRAQPNMKWKKKQSSNQQATLTVNQNKHEPSTNQGELIVKLTKLNLSPEEVEYERRKDIATQTEETHQ